MIVWLAEGSTYKISVTQSELDDEAMSGEITVNGHANLILLKNSELKVLGNLDLSYGPIKFYKDGDTYKVDYYDVPDATTATTATVLATAPFVVTQSGSDATENTIVVDGWGSEVPLNLTIDGLNIATNKELLVNSNAGHIDINGSAVNMMLSGDSQLVSTYSDYSLVMAALVSVDGTSALTIDGKGSLTVETDGRGAAIGGDFNSQVGSITINGGNVTAQNTGSGATIGSGYSNSSDSNLAEIKINGGKVTAYGGVNQTGVAIGGGASSIVTITGGEVEAFGMIGASRGAATITISGGIVSATANSDVAAIGSSADIETAGKSVSVIISGGTVTAKGIIGSTAKKYAKVTISGGSVKSATTNVGATNGSYSVYMITADVSDTVGIEQKPESASVNGVNYGFTDVYSDENGKIYLWLPNESTDSKTTATFNGSQYIGNVLTNHTGVFKLSPDIIAPTAKTLTYDGTAQALVEAGSSKGGALQYALGADGSDAPTDNWSTEIPVATNAGTYYVWYRFQENDRYVGTEAICTPVTIATKKITVRPEDQAVLVGGTPDAAKIIVSGELVNGHTLTVTLNGVDTSNTGEQILTIDSVSIQDANNVSVADNYTVTKESGTLTVVTHIHQWTYTASGNTITAVCAGSMGECPVQDKTVTITLVAPANQPYDGRERTVTVTQSPEVFTDIPAVTYSAGNRIDAGKYAASLTYNGVTASVNFTIEKKSLDGASVGAFGSLTYNGYAQVPEANVTVDGLTVTGSWQPVTDVDDIPVFVANGNFSGTLEVAPFMKPKAIPEDVVRLVGTLTYNGSELTQEITVDGGITYTVSGNKATNAGDYMLTVTGNGNYCGSVTKQWSIGKKELVITAEDKSNCAGNDQPALTYTVSGLVNGDTLTTLPTLTTDADMTTAGDYTITVSGADAGNNYTITYVNGTLKVAAEHIPGASATHTKAQTCTVCGHVLTPARGHRYSSEWKSNATYHWQPCSCGSRRGMSLHTPGDEAACTTAQTCTVCGYELQAALGHSYGTEWKSDETNHWYECFCGDKTEVTAHTLGDEATCTEDQICTVCTYVIDAADGHSYGTEWKSDGTNHWYECACGDVKDTAAHSGGTATCVANAKCSVCDAEYGELADHIPNEDDGDCTTDVTCSVCGVVTAEGADAHTGGTASCVSKAQCTVCGMEYGELAEHLYSEATCEKKATCSVCDAETGELAAHIPHEDDGNCTTDVTCSVCGAVTAEGADAHTGGTASCVSKAQCTVCGMEYGELAEHLYGEATCETKATCSVCDAETGELATHADSDSNGKCDTCDDTVSIVDPETAPETAPETDSETDSETAPDNQPEKPTDPTDPSDDPDGLGAGAIIGIVIVIVAVVAIGGLVFFWFVIKKKN